MFKEVFNLESILSLSRVALLIFVAVFVVMTLWAWTRSKATIDHWASLPLEDSTDHNNNAGQGVRS